MDNHHIYRARTLAWLSEMGFETSNSHQQIPSLPATSNPPESSRMSLLHAAGAVTVCLLLLGYCIGVVLFPNLN
jgi:hypothetical protein